MRSIRDLPTASGADVFGHMRAFRDARLDLFRAVARAGPISRMRFLSRYVVSLNTAEHAHEMLVDHARHSEKSPGIRVLLGHLAGDGLFTAEGETWRRQRRLMAPLFAPNAIGRYASAMYEVTEQAMARLADGAAIDLSRETTRITMGIVGRALFDSDTSDDADELGAALTTALDWVNQHSASSGLVLQLMLRGAVEKVGRSLPRRYGRLHADLTARLERPVLLRGARSPELRRAVARLDRKIQQMIDERRARPGASDDLLARLLRARDLEDASFAGMSDRQLRDEAVTLFVAGHETTATALAWTFYLLARHPAWRARVEREIALLPRGPIAFEDAARGALDVTSRVFKEALRLYPPVEVLARRTLAPIAVADVAIPERSIVFVSPWIVHRDAATWPSPERFDPDRFLPEAEAKRPRSAWMPFGGGPRVCIGNHFAMLEGPIVLATMMRAATFEIDEAREIVPESFATLRPRGGVPAVVRRRAARAGSDAPHAASGSASRA